MANSFLGNMPVDQPREIRPGVVHRESDFFAQEGPTRGFSQNLYTLAGPGRVGLNDGNRPLSTFPPRRALTGPGPFANLRGGR